jgi:chorismate lyase|tara:strand:+ start:28 stop:516 length:489 start_codon:yes stop_codon:yes gene_type:complete
MRTKRIGKWLFEPELHMYLNDEETLSWLLEDGSITQKISDMAIFKLEIIRDRLGLASIGEYWALRLCPQPVRVREVILSGNNQPMVYAKSIIPRSTSNKGYPALGKIGSKPLGDLIFTSNLFIKESRMFASFVKHGYPSKIWGRRTNYSVQGYPFSIMEVFL